MSTKNEHCALIERSLSNGMVKCSWNKDLKLNYIMGLGLA